MADSQDLKPLLLETDEEFRQLASKHHELEERLHELTEKHYLSGSEQVEEVTLKKRKLQLKDKMEDDRAALPGADCASDRPPRASSEARSDAAAQG